MLRKKTWVMLLGAFAAVILVGCNLGRVNQGRVVGYDKTSGVMTVVLESNQPKQPKYLGPAIAVKIPESPDEMGPTPEPGNLLLLDTRKHEILVYDPATSAVRIVSYTPVAERTGVRSDDPSVAKLKFPAVDRRNKTVTIYSRRQQTLVTLLLPDEYLAFPDNTWKAGDEVRYYYKQPEQAIRLMNVSKTDLNKAEK